MFESKFDMLMLYFQILYKLFQLLLRTKSDKSIASVPFVNVRTKFLLTIRRPLFFKMTKKEIRSLKWVLARNPMVTLSNGQQYLLSNVKNDSYEAHLRSSLRSFLIRLWTVSLLGKSSFIQFLIVSTKGMLVKILFTSNLVMIQLVTSY